MPSSVRAGVRRGPPHQPLPHPLSTTAIDRAALALPPDQQLQAYLDRRTPDIDLESTPPPARSSAASASPSPPTTRQTKDTAGASPATSPKPGRSGVTCTASASSSSQQAGEGAPLRLRGGYVDRSVATEAASAAGLLLPSPPLRKGSGRACQSDFVGDSAAGRSVSSLSPRRVAVAARPRASSDSSGSSPRAADSSPGSSDSDGNPIAQLNDAVAATSPTRRKAAHAHAAGSAKHFKRSTHGHVFPASLYSSSISRSDSQESVSAPPGEFMPGTLPRPHHVAFQQKRAHAQRNLVGHQQTDQPEERQGPAASSSGSAVTQANLSPPISSPYPAGGFSSSSSSPASSTPPSSSPSQAPVQVQHAARRAPLPPRAKHGSGHRPTPLSQHPSSASSAAAAAAPALPAAPASHHVDIIPPTLRSNSSDSDSSLASSGGSLGDERTDGSGGGGSSGSGGGGATGSDLRSAGSSSGASSAGFHSTGSAHHHHHHHPRRGGSLGFGLDSGGGSVASASDAASSSPEELSPRSSSGNAASHSATDAEVAQSTAEGAARREKAKAAGQGLSGSSLFPHSSSSAIAAASAARPTPSPSSRSTGSGPDWRRFVSPLPDGVSTDDDLAASMLAVEREAAVHDAQRALKAARIRKREDSGNTPPEQRILPEVSPPESPDMTLD